ncbi:MAG: 50S ribosomal protein L18 [Clostridiales bacterium]|jgi:large subunit ribosomal protein L18|nr:50S ribosomal protein L18 [Clostridiales bacterium]
MINKPDKNKLRLKRHVRVRAKISGTAALPRLNVYRSNVGIYVQVIDDETGHTLCSSSTLEKALKGSFEGKRKTEQSRIVGEAVAKKALALGITAVVFDRGGYLYTGRVKEVAEGARAAGLQF